MRNSMTHFIIKNQSLDPGDGINCNAWTKGSVHIHTNRQEIFDCRSLQNRPVQPAILFFTPFSRYFHKGFILLAHHEFKTSEPFSKQFPDTQRRDKATQRSFKKVRFVIG